MDYQLSLRPITPADQPFLFRVYASTRQEELAMAPWSDAEKEAFCWMQFNAQHTYYQQHYPKAKFQVILKDDEPVGRLYIDYRPAEIRLVDISILPEHRRQGAGSRILHEVLDEGQKTGLPVTIHVEKFNPARFLYDRLGFKPLSESDVYVLMEWRPKPAGSAPSASTL